MSSLERDHVPSPRPIAMKEIPLVDRIEEVKSLKETVDKTLQGEGVLVFLYGEAGIGKTRLARELAAYARLRGMQVLYGRCPALFRMDGVPPYVIWKEIIKEYLETSTPAQLYRVIGYYPAEVAKLVPEISQKLRSIPQSLPISPEQEQNRLFEAVSQFVTNISREMPLLVVLDDLQWTDPSSLLLLLYIARDVQKTPLLLLGVYRSTEIDSKHPLTPVLTELNRERVPQSVSVKRMSLKDISEMIKQMLEQDDVPIEFCELVYEKTRGNPFFAEEVIKSLKEEEAIYREANRWKIKEVTKIEFPETVKSVVKARIGRLDDEQQNVLTLASLVGNDFTFEALQGVTGLNEDKLRKMVDGLLKIGLLRHREVRGKDLCSFADVIVRDVVNEEVGTYERKKLHGLVGTTLEKVYASKIDEHLGELASHFLESGDKDKALDYFLKAGEKAQRVYANAEAASYFQSALRLLEEKEREPQEKGCVLERLGDIKKLVGEYDACMKYWNEALLLSIKKQEKEKTATLHRKIANVLWDNMGDAGRAEEHHDKASRILETEPESIELASLYEEMAHMYYRIGDIAKSLSWAERALELAEKLNAYEVVASSCASLGTIFSFTGDLKKARECLEKALKIALDNGYMGIALRANQNLAVALPAEENEKSLELSEKGFELAKKVGCVSYQSWIGCTLTWSYIYMGNMNKALALAEESVALDRKAGNMAHLSMSMAGLGVVYQILGEWDKSEQCHREASSISQGLNDWQAIWANCWGLGWLHLEKGELIKAREVLERACEVSGKAGAKYTEMNTSQWLVWTYIELGEIEKANNLIDSLQKFAFEKECKDLVATADALRAKLLSAQKKWEKSIELFEKSLQEHEALNARRWSLYPFVKLVLVEYARAYLERDQKGDREKAHNLLNQALEIFLKIGAKKDVEKVEARLLYIETGKVAPVPKPAELVSSGYADLDKLLCGGIPQNYAVVLTSPSCDERDMLVKSFLEAGAKNGENTFYVTIDPGLAKNLANEFQSNFHLFVCNPQADTIVRESPNIFNLKGVENLTDISIALTSAIRKLDPSLKGPRRICISLVSDVLLQHHAVQTRRWLTGLVSELRSNGFTALTVMDPEMHPSQEVRAVLDLFEGQIDISEKETEKGPERFLKIKRMSNRKYQENDLRLKREEL